MINDPSRNRASRAVYGLRRVAQTARSFSNWPELFGGLVRGRIGGGPAELTFRTRAGEVISVPNAPGARVPVYEVFAEDCYDLRWFLGALVDQPIHVLDVGAHVGTFATALVSLNPQTTVDCFEPAPDTYEYLVRNIAANDNSDRISAYPKAITGAAGTAVLDQQGAGSGHNHLAFADHLDGSGVEVETVTFDSVVAAARGPVAVIKMDCEGGEYDLVYKSSKESWANVQRLVLEYHSLPGETWDELRTWFEAVGLHVLRDEPDAVSGTAWLSRTPDRGPAPGLV